MNPTPNLSPPLSAVQSADSVAVVELPSGTSFAGGYESLNATSIDKSAAVNTQAALELLRSKLDLAEVEGLLVLGAIHPEMPSTFRNVIAGSDAFKAVPAEKVAELAKRRGNYTYINHDEIPHHPHIGRHAVGVATITLALAEMCGMDGATKAKAVELALLHDANKLADILLQRMREPEIMLEPAAVGLSPGNEVLDLLVASGSAQADAERMAAAAKFVAHGSIVQFLEILPGGVVRIKEGMLAEKLLHLADDMTSETTVLTTAERMVASGFRGKYEYLWTSGLGVFEVEGELMLRETSIPPQRGVTLVGAYANLQPLLSNAICAELLGSPDPSSRPDRSMKTMVTERLRGMGVLAV